MTADTAAPVLIRGRSVRTVEAADAVLIRDGRVLAVGRAEALVRDAASTLDLRELTLTPGATDAHIHLLEWALARRQVDVSGTASPGEAARRVAEDAEPQGGWIRGGGWNARDWDEEPRRELLDAVAREPVLLQSHDMHSVWASTAALERAGIDAGTPDPEGGRIERDADGRPTGVVRDNAVALLLDAARSPSEGEREAALGEGQAALHALGVVGVHTVEPDTLGLLQRARHDDRLRLRVLQHLPIDRLDDALRIGLRSGYGDEWLRIGGIKIFLDGALGSLTAWLREPYEGTADRGIQTLATEAFGDAVRRGSAGGLAMTVHAIGDAAVALALEALTSPEAAIDGPIPHRIEHAQLMAAEWLDPVRVRERAAHRIVCSVQPAHLFADWRAVDRHWGDRGAATYAFRSLERAGFTLAFGSDAPVEPPDPLEGVRAAVARQDRNGRPPEGWYPGERLSRERAWAGYTTGAARAAGDPRQGRLESGSFADLVAWDGDPYEPEGDAKPVLTMVGGEVVWSE